MRDVYVVVVPEWDGLRDSAGLPEFPPPANVNEMCIIDRAKLRESLLEARAERVYRWVILGAVVVGCTMGFWMGMHA